ncbi:MAG: hypothetical protein KAR19_14920 [Bacteroidales bacterium]|nr:hypothetical protein [Bacteroidales bacterium]
MAGLKEYIGWRVLKKKKKGFQREIQVHNFETAKSAVLLFDTSDPESFPVIKEFRKFIEEKGIQCRAFGFVRQKEIPQEMLFWKNYSFITRSDRNWYLKPTGEVVDAFYTLDPDILIDFTMQAPLELQFLVQLSTARFKIGCYTEQENDYDLMINLTGKTDIGYLADQIKHYVSMLNPSN